MRICDCIDTRGILGVSGLIHVVGSFGTVDGDVEYVRSETDKATIFEYVSDAVRLRTELYEREDGVFLRKDFLENLTDQPIEIYRLVSRFHLDGNEYDVYTQYNAWQHESMGSWQPLVTQVRAAASGIRTCDGATPMMALHNRYTERNTVFHLIPNAQWSMTVKKLPRNEKELVVLETGFYEEGLRLTAGAGERIELPTVIFFAAASRVDFDAYKLHRVYHELYPRRALPVAYNSWLYCFGRLNADDLMRQADRAAEMGFEAFMIDAGWFGSAEQSWSRSVGDWFETEGGTLGGRLGEISEHVRKRGMIFGLWFEPERAYATSKAVAEHPEYYIHVGAGKDYLLDFGNPEATDYMLAVISEQIEKYQIGWVKFDFNATIPYDPSGDAFYRYMRGQRSFILRLRERFDDLYLTNCASGGYRMELGQGMLFDSLWLSDNQGPYEGIRIVKDTLKRMPSALIERWNVQRYCEGIRSYHDKSPNPGRMIHSNNGTWEFLIGVEDSFSEAFVQGGLMGFSSDLDAFPVPYRERWRSVIEQYKQEREFYRTATARILVDSERIIAIEYADAALDTCILQVYTKNVYANELVIYPALGESARYRCGDRLLDGRDILKHGFLIENLKDNSCQTIRLVKESIESIE